MKINFQSIRVDSGIKDLEKHAVWLSEILPDRSPCPPGKIDSFERPVAIHGIEGYHTVDVIGKEFVWMNETFPKEKFTWYLWFESVFLVPEEMIPFLMLRWS